MTDKPKGLTIDQVDKLHAYVDRPVMNPQALIKVALENNAPIETLEKLVALTKEIRAFTAQEAWYSAMSEFQQECPSIKRTASARIPTRSGATYTYSYAPLDEILSTVSPILGKHGLSVSWRMKIEGQSVSAVCRISHRLGHTEDSGELKVPFANDGRMNPAQVIGSAQTYARRYSLLAILGIAPEEDDDAHATDSSRGERGEIVQGASSTEESPREDTGELAFESPILKQAEANVEHAQAVAKLIGRWRELELTVDQVKAVLRKKQLSESLARKGADWSKVDIAIVRDLLTEAGA